MKNKIKNLYWMLPGLMCTSSVFAGLMYDIDAPEYVRNITEIKGFILVPIMIFVAVCSLKIIVNFYVNKCKRELKEEERVEFDNNNELLKKLDKKRTTFTRICIVLLCALSVAFVAALVLYENVPQYSNSIIEESMVKITTPYEAIFGINYSYVDGSMVRVENSVFRIAEDTLTLAPLSIAILMPLTILIYTFLENMKITEVLLKQKNSWIKTLVKEDRINYMLSLLLINSIVMVILFVIFLIYRFV